jgi:hypothetical protein
MYSKFIKLSAAAAVTLLLASVAQAAGDGANSGRPVAASSLIGFARPVLGGRILIPVGTPVGKAVGFAPAVGNFPAAPITPQPIHANGCPAGAP